MSRLVPIVSLVLSAVAVALAAWPKDAAVASVAAAEQTRDDDLELEALKRRVEAIDGDQRALWSRLLQLEQRAGSAPIALDAGVMTAPAQLAADVAQLKNEVRAVMQGEVLSDSAGRSAMKDLVREVEADFARERLARVQEQQQQRAAEQQAKWKRFFVDARLTSQQEQTLTQRLSAEDTARKAMFERGTPPSREDFRTLRDQRRETDAVMLPLLDESQKQQYQELRRDEGSGPGGGGNRTRGGGRPQQQRETE